MPVGGTELEVLTAIANMGGRTSYQTVAKKVSLSSNYARLLCDSLGRADYIYLTASGACKLLDKGWAELERKGWEKPKKKGTVPQKGMPLQSVPWE